MRHGAMLKLTFLFVVSVLLSGTVFAGPLEGKKTVTLLDNAGKGITIGTVDFMAKGEGATFKIHLDHKLFTDHFLSMKEFKCLEGTEELACYVPYPYKTPRTVTKDDLSWLEHALLFLKKNRKEFGANLWNGMLYKLSIKGETIEGELRDIDLNMIASPPGDMSVAPYNEDEQVETDLGSRWLPRLVIR